MGYLFGSISIVAAKDIWLISALDVLVVGVSVVFYRQLQAVCFDEEFALLRGVRAKVYYLLLLCLTALVVVSLVRVVGNVMVIALLTLPAAVAGQFARRLWQMMALATLLCLAFIVAGLGVSYTYDWLPGPTIILVAGGVYLVVAMGRRLRRA